MPQFRTIRLLLFSILLCLPSAFAQMDRGTISGLVLDSASASVVNAKVTLANPSTGLSTATTTSSDGTFTFVGLIPGSYRLECEAAGFKKFVQENINVDVGRTTSVRVSLQPGEVRESVTVTAQAPAIDVDTSDVGTSVTRKQIVDLPVPLTGDSRNPMSFVILAPGVSGSIPGATPDMRLHTSGTPTGATEVYIDGIPMADTNSSGAFNDYHPSIEAVGEFKMSNNGQSAEYGLASGVVSFTFRSGTNDFHGSLFEFLQNDKLNAFDSPTKSIAAVNGKTPIKAPLKQNEYGFNLGGPVWIPKLYNGRNKTFFFANYTGFNYRPSSNNNSLTTMPNLYRTGNLSQALGSQLMSNGLPVFDAAGRPILSGQVYDPFSTHTVTGPDGQSYLVRDPVPGNIISSNDPHLSAVAQKMLKLFPNATSDAIFNNYTRNTRSLTDQGKLVIKLDQIIGTRNSLSGSYFGSTNDTSNNGSLTDLSAVAGNIHSKQFRVNETFTISPRVVNVITAGFLRDNYFNGAAQQNPSLGSFGITGIGLPDGAPFPAINVVGLTGIGGGTVSQTVQNRFIVSDIVNWTVGSHHLKLGGEYRRIQRNEVPSSGGSYDFRPDQTGLGIGFIQTASGPKAVTVTGLTGNSAASFLFGAVDYSRFDLGVTTSGYRWRQAAGFIQDDWKVSRTLTLNLGLRDEFAQPRSEVYGRIATMNPALPNPSAGNLPGAVEFYGHGPGRNGRDQIGRDTKLALQPRVGLAWAPSFTNGLLGRMVGDQKTVFRSSFALTRPLGNDNTINGITGGLYAPGFNGVAQVSRPGDQIGSPAFYWDQPFPSFQQPPFINPGTFVGPANPPYIKSDSGMLPTDISWSAGIQREVSHGWVAEANYVGTHTYHLGIWGKPNEIPPQVLASVAPAAAAANMPLNQFMVLPITDPRVAAAGFRPPWSGFVSAFGAGATLAQSLRPFPQYGNIDNPFRAIGSVSYNGLQTRLQKRFSAGLTMLLSYTFSKTIGDVDSFSGGSAGAENAIYAASFQQTYYNEHNERSVTSSDIPHVVALSYTYELPFGPGKKLLNSHDTTAKKILGQIVGGWEVSAIHLYQSGRPIHLEDWMFGADNPTLAQDGFSQRPDIVLGQPLLNPQWKSSCNGPLQSTAGRNPCQFYINPAAFKAPAAGTFGNAGKFLTGLRTPAYLNEDFSAVKRFHLTESVSLSFRANLFNAFNRVVWGNGGPATFQIPFAPPDLSAGSLGSSTTAFGIFTNQQNAPRRIQVAARLDF